MELTKEQAIKEHRKMWNWLSEHPDKDKYYYFERYKDSVHINNECFLCEYNFQSDEKHCGRDCIIDWGDAGGCVGENHKLGLYEVYRQLIEILFFMNKTLDMNKDIVKGLRLLISRTARAIAELPERKENEKNQNR